MTDVVALARCLLLGSPGSASAAATRRRARAFRSVGTLLLLFVAVAGSGITQNCCSALTMAPRDVPVAASMGAAPSSVTPDCIDVCDAPMDCQCPCHGTCPCVTGHGAALVACTSSPAAALSVATKARPVSSTRLGPGRVIREPALRPPIA